MPDRDPYRLDGTITALGLDKKTAKIARILNEFGDEGMSDDTKAANLLANLMHFCAEKNEDFERAIRVSSDHFAMESNEADALGISQAVIPNVKWAEIDALGDLLNRFGGKTEPRQDQLTDIVADLRHACANLEMGFNGILATARSAYEMQAPGNQPKL